MSLVDYASSDEDEDREEPKDQELQPGKQISAAVEERQDLLQDVPMHQLPAPKLDQPLPKTGANDQSLKSTVNRVGEGTSLQPEPPALKLPDASMLLNSPMVSSELAHGTDHSSRVAVAMAESESRKRDLNGKSSSSYTRSKVPRGNLPHSKSIPETVGGHLLPPQLAGR